MFYNKINNQRRRSFPISLVVYGHLGRYAERSWEYEWMLDVEIQNFFDTIAHGLMMKAVEHHCTEKWMRLYIDRWLKAPVRR